MRSFEAFADMEAYQRRPDRLTQYLIGIVVVFMLYLETSNWLGASQVYTYDVDKGVSDNFQINLDITMMDKCDSMGIMIYDGANDRLFVNELVDMVPVPTFDSMGEIGGEEWCRISGIFRTNRVAGRLSIGPKLPSLWGQVSPFNTSHYIHELSFGPYYPSQLNPLDDTIKYSQDGKSLLAYFLSIVPTTYKALGMTVETNQYTVTEIAKKPPAGAGLPGLHFLYDFEAISVTIHDDRIGFFDWLARVANIIGGLKVCASIFASRVKQEVDAKGLLD